MTVADLIAILGGDGLIAANDQVFVLGKNKLVIGRGPMVVAEINLARGVLTKGIGVSLDADACAAVRANSELEAVCEQGHLDR